MEEWRDIKGFEGLYQVSDQGRVKRLARWTNPGGKYNQWVDERLLTPYLVGMGYMYVHLCIKGKSHRVSVHRAVATAFLGDYLDLQVDHLNADRTDNRLVNLAWVTRLENMQKARASGAFDNVKHNSKIKYQQCLEMYKQGKSRSYVCKHLRMNNSQVIKYFKQFSESKI